MLNDSYGLNNCARAPTRVAASPQNSVRTCNPPPNNTLAAMTCLHSKQNDPKTEQSTTQVGRFIRCCWHIRSTYIGGDLTASVTRFKSRKKMLTCCLPCRCTDLVVPENRAKRTRDKERRCTSIRVSTNISGGGAWQTDSIPLRRSASSSSSS